MGSISRRKYSGPRERKNGAAGEITSTVFTLPPELCSFIKDHTSCRSSFHTVTQVPVTCRCTSEASVAYRSPI